MLLLIDFYVMKKNWLSFKRLYSFYVLLFFIYLFLNVFTLWTHVHFFRCILFIINCLSIYMVIFHLVLLNKNKNIIKQIKMIKKD